MKKILSVVALYLLGLVLQVQVAGKTQELSRIMKKASIAFVEGRYEEALQYLKKAYSILPDPNILWNIGRCYEEMGEYKDALRVFKMYRSLVKDKKSIDQADRKIKKIREDWADELEISGAKLEAEGKLVDALAMYRDAFQLAGRSEDLWKIAMIHKKRKEWALAIDALTKYISMHPGMEEEMAAKQELAGIKIAFQTQKLKRAEELVAKGQYSAAMALLRSAYKLRNDPAVLWEIGRLYEKWGKYEEAKSVYKRILQMEIGVELEAAVKDRLAFLETRKNVDKTGIHQVVKRASPLKTAGYITGGLGGAVLVTGVVFVGLAYSDFGTLDTAQQDKEGRIVGLSQKEASELKDRAEIRQTLGWVLIGAGAGTLAVSGVLYWLGVREEHVQVGIGPSGTMFLMGEF